MAEKKAKKREKYAVQACDSCKKRKVKCDGNLPCKRCFKVNSHCSYMTSSIAISRRPVIRSMIQNGRLGYHNSLSSRLESPDASGGDKSEDDPVYGESSLNQVLDAIEKAFSTSIIRTTRPSVFKTNYTDKPHEKESQRGATESMTRVVPDLSAFLSFEYDSSHYAKLLEVYFNQCNILYPVIHPPSLWEFFFALNSVKTEQDLGSRHMHLYSNQFQERLAQVYLCLAIAESMQIPSDESVLKKDVPPGSKYFHIAESLIGQSDIINIFSLKPTKMPSIELLQCIILVAMFYYRLDYYEKAESAIQQALRLALMCGINRNETYNSLSVVEAEIRKRLWFSLQAIDYRCAIAGGVPYCTHMAADIQAPLDITDKEYERLRMQPLGRYDVVTLSEAALDPALDLLTASEDDFAEVSFLKYNIDIVHIGGTMWRTLYCSGARIKMVSVAQINDICNKLDVWQQQVPLYLQWDALSVNDNMTKIPPWLCKQRLILHVSCWQIKLLAARTVLFSSENLTQPGFQECAQDNANIALSVIQLCDEIFAQWPAVFCSWVFPLDQYLLSATMFLLGLMVNCPETYLTSENSNNLQTSLNILANGSCRVWRSPAIKKAIACVDRLVQVLNQVGSEQQEQRQQSPSADFSEFLSNSCVAELRKYLDESQDLKYDSSLPALTSNSQDHWLDISSLLNWSLTS
ncbi:hypothetical protein CANCADRAFT_66482 [Tortispora caseinolytica NRRL Y-17796]|uniref:Zn(2)-C6 fungal-type domain-containing protein n=1 Tax=Tortispora caseinolytica NRRL Y-17796 TaxID=767744 RepID=A0A1E4TIP2_9ASCO|nr:hypothetical protein CANCADRAFT_66482 [Tortispora caseinolytica NRRL Y-17796]